MKFTVEIKNRWSAKVQFSCEVETSHNARAGLKLGLAVKEGYRRGADLRCADLSGAKIGNELIPTDEQAAPLLAEVAAAALACDDALNMSTWHTCETTHCIAGWAIKLAGERGAALEAEYGSQSAGMALLGVEAALHFFDTDTAAREWLRTKVKA
jgi:hypothetical protein